jgi:hypothetical protein
MTYRLRAAAVFAVLILVAGCAGRPRMIAGPPPAPTDRENSIRMMLSFDLNKDGTVTREEVEQVLRQQFAATDLNHDGVLDQTEVAAENDRRYKASGTGFSPLIDWNQDGKVDFAEYATTAHSVFADLDRNHNGVLEVAELRLPRMPGQPAPRRTGFL